MADRLTPGTKVTCRPKEHRWATLAFPEINGKVGRVERHRDGVPGFDRDCYLVAFEERVGTSTGWWLDADELEVCP